VIEDRSMKGHHSYGAALFRRLASAISASAALAAVVFLPARALPPNAAESAAGPAAFTAEPITPIEAPSGLDPAKVALGKRLFGDVRLSHGDQVACLTCHPLNQGGTDHSVLRASPADGAPLDYNIPGIFNAVLNFRFNWTGSFRTVEEQNEFVLLNPRLMMNASWEEILSRLRADSVYRESFAATYGGPVEHSFVLDALASYERSLVTPDAPFDRYLRGDTTAITRTEEEGYRLFKSLGCVSCHQGGNVGGNLFEPFGVFEEPYPPGVSVRSADLGRFSITGTERDRYVFRVPSLRNIAQTAPYFHDGSAPTLEMAVRVMAQKQLGRRLKGGEVDLLVGFLKTLTGTYLGHSLIDSVVDHAE
jgi:cytochrome c peroxidase